MAFNPTHSFREIELQYDYAYDMISGIMTRWYKTKDGARVVLPDNLVAKIQPKPKPGEVWFYDEGDDEVGKFSCVITEDGRGFRTSYSQYEPLYDGDLKYMTKILNADGSPA